MVADAIFLLSRHSPVQLTILHCDNGLREVLLYLFAGGVAHHIPIHSLEDFHNAIGEVFMIAIFCKIAIALMVNELG